MNETLVTFSPTTIVLDIITLPPLIMLGTWLIYDLLVVGWLKQYGFATITHTVIELSRKYPAIPYMTGLIIGLVTGHLFGQF